MSNGEVPPKQPLLQQLKYHYNQNEKLYYNSDRNDLITFADKLFVA